MKNLILSLLISLPAYAHDHQELLGSKWKIECDFDEDWCGDTDAVWEFTETKAYVTKFHHNTNIVKSKKEVATDISLTGKGEMYFKGPGYDMLKDYEIKGSTLKICDSECRNYTKYIPK